MRPSPWRSPRALGSRPPGIQNRKREASGETASGLQRPPPPCKRDHSARGPTARRRRDPPPARRCCHDLPLKTSCALPRRKGRALACRTLQPPPSLPSAASKRPLYPLNGGVGQLVRQPRPAASPAEALSSQGGGPFQEPQGAAWATPPHRHAQAGSAPSPVPPLHDLRRISSFPLCRKGAQLLRTLLVASERDRCHRPGKSPRLTSAPT